MKQIRLTQTAPVMIYLKEKYGRPGVAGRKRSIEGPEDSEAYLSKRANRCHLVSLNMFSNENNLNHSLLINFKSHLLIK